jgi:hypothetical protein
MFGQDARGAELVTEMNGVSDARRKSYGWTPLSQPKPVGSNVANQLLLVHALSKLVLHVVAALNANAR